MLSLFFMTRVSSRRPARTGRAGPLAVSEIEGEIKSHVEAIALYESEAGSSDVQLRTFAQRILPQLRRHLDLLRSLETGNGHGE